MLEYDGDIYINKDQKTSVLISGCHEALVAVAALHLHHSRTLTDSGLHLRIPDSGADYADLFFCLNPRRVV